MSYFANSRATTELYFEIRAKTEPGETVMLVGDWLLGGFDVSLGNGIQLETSQEWYPRWRTPYAVRVQHQCKPPMEYTYVIVEKGGQSWRWAAGRSRRLDAATLEIRKHWTVLNGQKVWIVVDGEFDPAKPAPVCAGSDIAGGSAWVKVEESLPEVAPSHSDAIVAADGLDPVLQTLRAFLRSEADIATKAATENLKAEVMEALLQKAKVEVEPAPQAKQMPMVTDSQHGALVRGGVSPQRSEIVPAQSTTSWLSSLIEAVSSPSQDEQQRQVFSDELAKLQAEVTSVADGRHAAIYEELAGIKAALESLRTWQEDVRNWQEECKQEQFAFKRDLFSCKDKLKDLEWDVAKVGKLLREEVAAVNARAAALPRAAPSNAERATAPAAAAATADKAADAAPHAVAETSMVPPPASPARGEGAGLSACTPEPKMEAAAQPPAASTAGPPRTPPTWAGPSTAPLGPLPGSLGGRIASQSPASQTGHCAGADPLRQQRSASRSGTRSVASKRRGPEGAFEPWFPDPPHPEDPEVAAITRNIEAAFREAWEGGTTKAARKQLVHKMLRVTHPDKEGGDRNTAAFVWLDTWFKTDNRKQWFIDGPAE